MLIQFGLAAALLTNVTTDWLRITNSFDSNDFSLVVAKLMTTITVHLYSFPYVVNAFKILRYTNNHPEKFDSPLTAYIIGFLTLSIYMISEVINMIALYSKTDVFSTVNMFITQFCVIELSGTYFNFVIAKDTTLRLNEIIN